MSNLATQSFWIDVGGARLHVVPRRVGNDVFFRVEVKIPYLGDDGKVYVTLSMTYEVFREMMTLIAKYNVIPRLSDLLEGTFGKRPTWNWG